MNNLKGKEGGCLCGAVRYRLEENPMYVQACHCLDCQTVSGSAFAINLWMEEANVAQLGVTPVPFMNVAGSGKAHEIFSCEKCGTAVFSKYHASPVPDQMVRAGTLDDTSDVEPMAHIYTATKQFWIQLPEDKPNYPGSYKLFEVWPEASAARFRALLAQVRGK